MSNISIYVDMFIYFLAWQRPFVLLRQARSELAELHRGLRDHDCHAPALAPSRGVQGGGGVQEVHSFCLAQAHTGVDSQSGALANMKEPPPYGAEVCVVTC